MNTANDDARRRAWTSYWSAGSLHSCAGSYAGNYTGAIASFWRSVLERTGPELRALDLATGNGALPLLLWEQRSRWSSLQVDAVDLAVVAPSWHDKTMHAGIRFHSGVAMEQLPFPAESFDLVASQFGLEYARRPDSLRECLRVADSHATIALVMHHADSVLVKVGRCELDHQQLLMSETGVIQSARQVIPWMARARAGEAMSGNVEALQSRQAYNNAVGNLGVEIESSAAPDLLLEARAHIHALLLAPAAVDVAVQLQALDAYEDALKAAGLRTSEMIQHALDISLSNEIVDFLRTARPTHAVSCQPISQAEGLLAWGLVATPA